METGMNPWTRIESGLERHSPRAEDPPVSLEYLEGLEALKALEFLESLDNSMEEVR
jgi:hypothetical protein